jgi:hypothetical protein
LNNLFRDGTLFLVIGGDRFIHLLHGDGPLFQAQ